MKSVCVVACLALLVACRSADDADGGTASASAVVEGDAERGRVLSLACQACHSLNAGGAHLVGPNLHGVFGRAAGTAAGFGNYSDALKRSGIVWSAAELDRWLADPAGFLPGTTMAFSGYQSAADRAMLIAYLVAATKPGEPGSAE